MRKNDRLVQSYKEYCFAEGNQHISSEYAIIKIQELVDKFQISSILELGLGIGSICGSLLDNNKEIKYFGTESNEFCKHALAINLGAHYERLKVFSKLEDVPRIIKFDLVIIDGKDKHLNQISEFLSEKAIIAIEGDRMPQQTLLMNLFPNHKLLHSVSIRKNEKYSPFPESHWQGGLKVIFVEPSLGDKFWWLREKIKTRVKYQFRKWL
jgi:hypothetical protein